MDQAERRQAKAQLVANMAEGQFWREAGAGAGLTISRSAAYRLAQRVRTEGAVALEDQRHGHPSKLSAPVAAVAGGDVPRGSLPIGADAPGGLGGALWPDHPDERFLVVASVHLLLTGSGTRSRGWVAFLTGD